MNSKPKRKPKVLVVAHDAGGAEIIAAYVRKYMRRYAFRPYVDGLAARIFKREGIPFARVPRTRAGMARIIEQHRDAAFALIGTGWMTAIEANACKEAKAHGVKACIYLDSWVNYRGRFGYPKRGWQEGIPDEFWVGDPFALALAKNSFPRVPVRLVPNQYFADILKRYKQLARRHRAHKTILFFSTPDAEGKAVLSELLRHLALSDRRQSVLIRFHPADDRRRYDALRKKYGTMIRIEVSREQDIARDLIRARFAIGPETMALAVAAMVGIDAVCVVAPGKKPVLPFRRMHRATSMRTAARFVRMQGSERKRNAKALK